ncbi:MAG: hypothetical protein ACRBN8_10495 [Nannocystales bacterium]
MTEDGVTWEQEAEDGSPTTFAPVTQFNDELWVVGGIHDGAATNEAFVSSDGITWSRWRVVDADRA